MSKFLRTMTALSKKPSDFQKPPPDPQPESQTGTVPDATTVPEYAAALTEPVPLSDTVPETGTVPDLQPPGSPKAHARVRVFRATRVEHGHSIGEHLIYEVLWRNSAGNDQTRTIQIGYDRLGSLANVNWKTAKSCLKTLEEKLAIEVIGAENSNERTGRTYRVYSFTAILERRRKAGMEWVEKGRGVKFIAAGTVPVFTTVPFLTTVVASHTVPETGTESVLKSGTVSVPETGIPLGSNRNIEKITSSSSVAAVNTAARKYGIVLDDDAARKLVRRCRSGREDVTDDELAYFTELKVNQLKSSRTIENWVGMLIASVPVYFEGPATELYRYREQKARETEQSREAARVILANPEASDHDREWARSLVAEDAP